jgi:hypothetical protein
MLGVPSSRKAIYFGLINDNETNPKHLNRWVKTCHTMRLNREQRESARLQALYRIARRLEMIRKFKDWKKFVFCRKLLRRHLQQRCLDSWKSAWMVRKCHILLRVSKNVKFTLLYRYKMWAFLTRWYRAVDFATTQCQKRCFVSWRAYWLSRLSGLLEMTFERWKSRILLSKQLKKLVLYNPRDKINSIFLNPYVAYFCSPSLYLPKHNIS